VVLRATLMAMSILGRCVCCRVLQGVAGCCRVLQGVAGCCSVLQWYYALHSWQCLFWVGLCVAECCRVLQGVAVVLRAILMAMPILGRCVCCRVLQGVAVCCSGTTRITDGNVYSERVCLLQCVAVRCRVLQGVAVCCSGSTRCTNGNVYSGQVCVLQCVAVCCRVLQCVAVGPRAVLTAKNFWAGLCVAVCAVEYYSCVAVRSNVLQ